MHALTLALALVAAAPETTKTVAPPPAAAGSVAPPAAVAPAPASTPPALPQHSLDTAPRRRGPAPPPTDSLDLAVLEREALARNPSLAAMRAAASAASARARVAGSLDDPMLSVGFAPRSYFEAGTSPAAEMTPAADRFPAWSVGIRQRLPIFGERGLERASATSDAAAAALDAEAARLDLIEQVRLVFFDVYRVDRALETNDEQADLMGQFRRVALMRYAAGTEGQQDPLTADAELGMLVHQRAALESQRRDLAAQMNALLHRPAGSPLAAAPTRLAIPAPDTSSGGPGVWPEVRASEARLAASESQLALSRRRRLPVIEVGVEQNLFMESPERRTMATIGLNLPIAGGKGAEIAAARADRRRAEYERAAAADAQASRVEQARADYEESIHEVEVLETIVAPTTERAVVAARSAYENGRATFLPLIDAARRRADVRLEIESARVRAARAWASLARATAGDATSISPDDGKEPQ